MAQGTRGKIYGTGKNSTKHKKWLCINVGSIMHLQSETQTLTGSDTPEGCL